MSEIKTNGEDLILHAAGADKSILFHSDSQLVGFVDQEGFKDEYGNLLRASLAPMNSIQNVSGTSGTVTLDCSIYDTFVITVTGSMTIAFSNFVDGRRISISLTDANAHITWPAEVTWPTGADPIFDSSGTDRVSLQQLSGSIVQGFIDRKLEDYPINSMYDVSATTGVITLDCYTYDTFIVTATAAITLTFSNYIDGRIINVIINNGLGNITWPTEVVWPDGTSDSPELSIGKDRIVVQRLSSSFYQGFFEAVPDGAPVNTLEDITGTSGTIDLDCYAYDTFVMTITGATTLTFSNLVTGRTIGIVISNGTTNITWPTEIDWPEGEEPEFSTGTDRVVIQKLSATVYHGSLAGIEYA